MKLLFATIGDCWRREKIERRKEGKKEKQKRGESSLQETCFIVVINQKNRGWRKMRKNVAKICYMNNP